MKDYILIPDLEKLTKSAYNEKIKFLYRLSDQCERYFYMHLDVEHPSGSTTYMGVAILNLALMYKLTKEPKYYRHAKRFIETVCNYKVWGHAHLVNVDLSASWILFGLSVAYNWLEEDMDPEFKQKVYDKLVLQSKIMYDYKMETNGKGWATNYYQNHNWINMTGIAACGYALKGKYEFADAYIKEARDNFEIVYDFMAADGSNYEGTVYWRYGGMWLFIYADLLKDRENVNFFETSGYLRNTFYYRLYQAASDLKKQLNFGDCHDRYSSHTAAVYYKVAAEYKDGYAQTLANLVSGSYLYEEGSESKVKPGILPEAFLELLWADVTVAEQDINELPHVKHFEDLGLITIRNGFGPESTVYSFKCGYPGGKIQWENGWKVKNEKDYSILALSHHHPDNLSFLLTKGHSYFAIDDGYNRNIMPDNHNIIMVDGKYTDVCDVNDVYMASIRDRIVKNPTYDPANYFGSIKYFNTCGTKTSFKGETSAIYPLEMKMTEVSRSVLTNDLKYIVMVDRVKSELEHTYQTVFNSDFVSSKVNDSLYQFKNIAETMNYHIFSDKCFEDKKYSQKVTSVMTTQEPDKLCIVELETLGFASKEKVKEQTFVHVLTFSDDLNVSFENGKIIVGEDTIVLDETEDKIL